MEKRAYDVVIKTDKGEILIEQDDYPNDSPSCVRISPDQVDLVCEWLRAARAELANPQ